MLKNYFSITNNIFIYIECEAIYVFSFLGIIKVKNSFLNYFFIKKKLLCSYEKHITITFFFREIFLLISQGYYNIEDYLCNSWSHLHVSNAIKIN